MTGRRVLALLAIAAALAITLFAQKVWREYPAFEYNDFPIPPDYQEKTEWAFARLMYPNMPGVHGRSRGYGRFGGYSADWTQGGRGVYWTMDYPRSDRHFALALRRLTRIHVRSAEEPVNLDEGDQYNRPWMYAVEVTCASRRGANRSGAAETGPNCCAI